jgi:hypothetical protein
MGEFSKHLGQGTLCSYCGEHELGAVAKTVKVINFEDWYPEEGQFVVDPSQPLEAQLMEYIRKSGPDPEDCVQCPMCKEVADPDYGDIVTGDLWECVTCEEIHTDADEAEACCKYQREYNDRHSMYAARERDRMIEEAKNLLMEEGFLVGPPQPAQPRLQPQPLQDW